MGNNRRLLEMYLGHTHVTKKAVNMHDNAQDPLVMSGVSELPITPGNLL